MSLSIRKTDDNQKLLLEIIKRFDTYINASNAKIAIILSYCMTYIGGLGLKLVDISDKRTHDITWWALLFTYLASVIITLWAARIAYQALAPQLPSGHAGHEQPSVLFFGDVATHPGGRDGYVASICQLTDEAVLRDLSIQAYTLAAIARSKFLLIDRSTKFLVIYQIPLFSLILVILLVGLEQAPLISNKTGSP